MTSALEGGEGSASRPGSTLPPGKTRYPLYRRLGGPQGRSGQVRKNSPPPGFDPRTVQPVGSQQSIILYEISKREANWICHILSRNCLLQRVTEEKIKGGIEVTERPRRRRKKIVGELKDRRGYCHLKEEALDRTVWRAGFGRGFGPVVRQTAK